jgi:hypothetical protein
VPRRCDDGNGDGEQEGLVKTVFDAKTGELLGAHMVGAEVTELIQCYTIARTLESTEAELMATVFPHPTISETMHEAVLAAYGRRCISDWIAFGNLRLSSQPNGSTLLIQLHRAISS